jgi:stage II sporulation protein D
MPKMIAAVIIITVLFSAHASARFKKQEAGPEKTVRIAIAKDVTTAELQKGPAKVNADGTVAFRKKTFHGRLEFYDNGGGTLTAVNILPIEEYLVGLVAAEMSVDWPLEALKAQAAASRTYALYQREARTSKWSDSIYDLESSVLDQVYDGSVKDDSRVRGAVEATRGEVLKRRGRLVKAFFHSACGGRTESAVNVWGEEKMFDTVRDPYCKRSPNSSWSYKIPRSGLAERLAAAGYPAERIDSVSVERRRNDPRAATVAIDTGGQTVFLQGSDLRRIIGYENVKSTWFDVRFDGDELVFTGRGFGHGVGLCQWGAKGMAEAGKDYREILKFYYPGTRLEKQ